VDRELLTVMKRAGCVGIQFGVDGGHPDILERLGKQTTVAHSREAFRLCAELHIPTIAFVLVGTPWETDETFYETIALVRGLSPTVPLFFAARAYPGTALRRMFREAGMALPDAYEDYTHYVEGRRVVSTSPAFVRQEQAIRRRCREATRQVLSWQVRHPRLLWRLTRELIHLYGLRRVVRDTVARLGRLSTPICGPTGRVEASAG